MNLNDLEKIAINPLHQKMLIATMLKAILAKQYENNPSILPELNLAYSNNFTITQFDKDNQGNIIYPTKEIAGVAGLYEFLQQENYEVIFANDFSLDIHGIDAVAQDKKTGQYIICEAKGSSLAKIKSFSSYLKKTKHKGRQLSSEWCWASLIDYAFQSTTADIFLKLLEPILFGRIERLLSVSLLEEINLGYKIVDKKIWLEEDMVEKPWFKNSYNLSKQVKWFDEIKSYNSN